MLLSFCYEKSHRKLANKDHNTRHLKVVGSFDETIIEPFEVIQAVTFLSLICAMVKSRVFFGPYYMEIMGVDRPWHI